MLPSAVGARVFISDVDVRIKRDNLLSKDLVDIISYRLPYKQLVE